MTIKDDVLKQIEEYHNISKKDKYKLISSINKVIKAIDNSFPDKKDEIEHKFNLLKKDVTNELVNLKLTNNLNNYSTSLWTYQIKYQLDNAYTHELIEKLGFVEDLNFDFLVNELLGNKINTDKIEKEEIDIEKQLNNKVSVTLRYDNEHFNEATIKLHYPKDDYDLFYSETVYSPENKYLTETDYWKYKYYYLLKIKDEKLIDRLDKEGIDAKVTDDNFVNITLKE